MLLSIFSKVLVRIMSNRDKAPNHKIAKLKTFRAKFEQLGLNGLTRNH